ncbi:tRNA pseudouridine synthase A [Trichonephila clavata]|uniref:Pseudouridylate synthase 1 homolog n=1 Tax=Trichonephila clavata TaxID=2740835 RepID=A0A8X6LZZ4_TRICU|nr:tRNA pseudouridine synthase A [Trichonephila clavata]
MLRKLFLAFYTYPVKYSRSSSNLIMSSEQTIEDVLKRKPEEDNCVESVTKKHKPYNDEKIDEIIKKAAAEANRVRKPKKVVLLMCYLGKEFSGMQRNSNVSTVEEELLKALLKANIIIQAEFDHPKLMKFQRAARTDKGVSAVRQIVSLKLPVKEITDELPTKVNNHLPPEIRVVGVRRVTQSFDAKIACDARTYSYMIPTFAFAPLDEKNLETYKISADTIEQVNVFLKSYLGTRNFYNFTSGRLPGDPSCKRYIMSFDCGPPFESHGIEFSVIKVKGQSFMLHQIRKMVGLTIAVIRNLTDESILSKVWHSERIDIPKAPGLGLMLEELHYDWYNKKYGSDGMHKPLKWDEFNDQIEVFKVEKICANIAKTEREEKSMLQWLETLPHHSYDVRDAGPPTQLPSKIAENNNAAAESSSQMEKTDDFTLSTVADVKHLIHDITSDTPGSESTSVLGNSSQETEIKCPS